MRLIVFIFKTLKLQKENSPRRGGSFLCDQKEGDVRPCAHTGSPWAPHPTGMWPCMDTNSSTFEDQPLSKLKESDRCSARENLYLDALSLDDEPEEPPDHKPEREFRNCFPEVSLGLGCNYLRQDRGQGLGKPAEWLAGPWFCISRPLGSVKTNPS